MADGGGTLDAAVALRRIIEEDAVRQLRRREGRMAALGSEDGALKLDWVEGVARLLAEGTRLEEVEEEARALWRRGIRHLIWAGMGGSILTVRVLAALGFCDGARGARVAIYPLDSTDPAALNAIVRRIAQAKQLALPPAGTSPDAALLHALLHDVAMVGVSMGMTSEEPITHLAWFTDLLERAQLQPAEHLLVMTLPGSYLDHFARERKAPSRPLQLDGGNGTGGRMSAPTTRVFLLPAALYLTRLTEAPGQLRAMLSAAWQHYDLDLATSAPAQHPFVRLAAALTAASMDGACQLLLEQPGEWRALTPWIEQLMEESLGKGGKGVVVFDEQPLQASTPGFRRDGTLHVRVTIEQEQEPSGTLLLHQPYLEEQGPGARLAALAASFLGWQLSMALYGYLQEITFAGQPAVENYKARARALREKDDPLAVLEGWRATFRGAGFTMLAPPDMAGVTATPAEITARELRHLVELVGATGVPGYLDFTINGEVPATPVQKIADYVREIGNNVLGVPVKLRVAPASYHSTEQSEMDGPPTLVSLRLLLREHEACAIGKYTDTFLRAQAVSTWQAMIEQGRRCLLLVVDGGPEQAERALQGFFEELQGKIQVGT